MAKTGRKSKRAGTGAIDRPELSGETKLGAFARFRRWIRNSFLTGMLVTVPVLATYVVVKFLIGLIDKRVPEWMRPDIQLLGYRFPLVGTMLAIVIVLLVGILTRNLAGRRVIRFGESLIRRVPVARAIYTSTKQFMQTLFSKSRDNFKRVVLIEYPRKGLYTMVFVTGRPLPVYLPPDDRPFLSVFVPTTPNPTSGFFLMVPEEDTIPLAISVEQAFRAIISAGMTTSESDDADEHDLLFE